jgi:type II secretory pathway pseudopilin PulG
MALAFTCPHCGSQTEVAEEFAGKSGPCAFCGRRVTVPLATPGAAVPVEPPVVRTSRWLLGCLITVACVVVVGACAITAVPFIGPYFQSAQRKAQQNQAQENVRQIAEALLRYHQDHGEFPPAYTVDAKGKPLHSWRVLILPYLGEQNLYSQIRLNEPWDSPYNQRFHSQMPAVFQEVNATPGNNTCCVAIEGKGFVFDGTKKTKLDEIKDGASDTILVLEISGSDIPWMEPKDFTMADVDFTPGSNVGGFVGSQHSKGAYVGLGDGSSKLVSDQMDASEFKTRLTISGNESKPPW